MAAKQAKSAETSFGSSDPLNFINKHLIKPVVSSNLTDPEIQPGGTQPTNPPHGSKVDILLE